MWYRTTVIAVAAMTTVSHAWAQAGRSRLEFESLSVIPGVLVQVDGVTPEAAQDGLSADSLRADVESMLEARRVAVLTKPQWQQIIGNPALHLDFQLLKFSRRQYIYNVTLEVRQLTLLMRDSTKMVFTRTWASDKLLGAVSVANLSSLRDRVRPLVRQFVNAYSTATGRAGRRAAGRGEGAEWRRGSD